MKYDNCLILFKKYEEFIIYTGNLLIKFPKVEKYLFTNQIVSVMYNIQEKIAFFVKEQYKPNKVKLLHEIDVYLSMFKGYIRISYSKKYISHQNYETWAKQITEISNILGGLILSAKNDKK